VLPDPALDADASPAALRAVRSAPVSQARESASTQGIDMRVHWPICTVIACSVVAWHSACADTPSTREYTVAGAGSLTIEVNDRWIETSAPAGPPGTIAFRLKEPLRLLFLVSPLQIRRPEPLRDSDVKNIVAGEARQLQEQSVEDTLDVRAIAGRQARGYQFHATDRAPGPEEYRFVYQGTVLLDSLMVTFTILYNEGAEDDARRALDAIRDLTFTRAA